MAPLRQRSPCHPLCLLSFGSFELAIVLGVVKAGLLRSRLRRALTTPARDGGGSEAERRLTMLRIYSRVLGVLQTLAPIVKELNRHDPDLARQLRRASASVALNIAEGCGSQGKNRRARYYNALGSARETLACLEVAQAQQVLTFPSTLAGELDEVIAVLYTLTR